MAHYGVVSETPNLVVTSTGLSTFVPTGGTATRTVADKAGEQLSVFDSFATGDGTTDDTTAIQNAINDLGAAGGGVLLFPPGDYKITSTLTVTHQGLWLLGAGADNERLAWGTWPTRLFWAGTTGLPMFEIDSGLTEVIRSITFERMVIDGADTTGGYPILGNPKCNRGLLRDVIFRNFKAGIIHDNNVGWLYDRVVLFNFQGVAVTLKASCHHTTFRNLSAVSTGITSGLDAVVRIGEAAGHCSAVAFDACDLEHGGATYQIDARNVRGLNISGGYMEALDAASGFIKLGDTADGTSVDGGSISGGYYNGASLLECAIDIEKASGIVIGGNHGREFTAGFIRGVSGATLKGEAKGNHVDTGLELFADAVSAEGFDVGQDGENVVENAAFDVWQAGTSFAVAALTETFVADRWKGYSAGANRTLSRQAGWAGATWALRIQRNVGNASTSTFRTWHQLESHIATQLAGKRIRVSFDMTVGADISNTMSVLIGTGTAGGEASLSSAGGSTVFATGGALTNLSTLTLVASEQRRVRLPSFVVPSDAKDMVLGVFNNYAGTAGAADFVEITNVKIEVGDEATPFRPQPMAKTLEDCRRHYQKSFALATAPAQNVGAGTGEYRAPLTIAGANVNYIGTVQFQTPMRATPTTITFFNPAAANAEARNLVDGADCSATAATNVSANGFEIETTGNAGGAVGENVGVHWTAAARL